MYDPEVGCGMRYAFYEIHSILPSLPHVFLQHVESP
jgi:hypothetical protein